LNAGWNLIPVLSNCPVDVASLFDGTSAMMVKEVAGWQLYWPAFGINTLGNLVPGRAYYVNMQNAETITFPDCDGLKTDATDQGFDLQNAPENWAEITLTPISHVIAIPKNAAGFENISVGDWIGVTDENGNCFGVTQFTGDNMSVQVFGNDPLSDYKDGFEAGEYMQFVHFATAENGYNTITTVFDAAYPSADGQFTENGISVVKSLEATGASIAQDEINISIYPNPVSTNLIIQLDQFENTTLEVMNLQGQLLYSGKINAEKSELDFSTYTNGVYLVKLSGNGINHVERITKQ
jgi:hypothetical protein